MADTQLNTKHRESVNRHSAQKQPDLNTAGNDLYYGAGLRRFTDRKHSNKDLLYTYQPAGVGGEFQVKRSLIPSLTAATKITDMTVPKVYKWADKYTGVAPKYTAIVNTQAGDDSYAIQAHLNSLAIPSYYLNRIGMRIPLSYSYTNDLATPVTGGYMPSYGPDTRKINMNGTREVFDEAKVLNTPNRAYTEIFSKGLYGSDESGTIGRIPDYRDAYGYVLGHEATHAAQVDYPSPLPQITGVPNSPNVLPGPLDDIELWSKHYNIPEDAIVNVVMDEPYAHRRQEIAQAHASFNRSLHALKRAVSANRQKYIDSGYSSESLDRLVAMPTFLSSGQKGTIDFDNRMDFFRSNPQFGELLGAEGNRFPALYHRLASNRSKIRDIAKKYPLNKTVRDNYIKFLKDFYDSNLAHLKDYRIVY